MHSHPTHISVTRIAIHLQVFTWDSGNNVGEIAGHAKLLISCAFKTTRPFRIMTGSEDNSVILHEGPPFKLKTLVRVRMAVQ